MNDYELKTMNKQLEEELDILNSTIRKITKATTTEEVFKLMLVANKFLCDVCREREYIIGLERDK